MAVNPLTNGVIKPFPLRSFGLVNITSKDDAKKQIRKPHGDAANAETDANSAFKELEIRLNEHYEALANMRNRPNEVAVVKEEIERLEKTEIPALTKACQEIAGPIQAKHRELADTQVSELEARWPIIEPALKAHLARQERRLEHFKRSCRILGCHDPKRASRSAGSPRKSRRGAQHFCGPHSGMRGVLKTEDYGRLGDFKLRVELTA